MPPLTAPELDRWERRFARSLEDLELLHASDGQLARRETEVRQARVRKQKKTRPCSTPKHSIGKRNDARAAYANDRAQLLEVLASDCGCALHAEGCSTGSLHFWRRLPPPTFDAADPRRSTWGQVSEMTLALTGDCEVSQ